MASTEFLRIDNLHNPLKREFIEEQGWLPLEQVPEGLVVLCLDPEAVRAGRVVVRGEHGDRQVRGDDRQGRARHPEADDVEHG